jgi:23S rRNA (guanosine2251-2'-O)-methyltransferase
MKQGFRPRPRRMEARPGPVSDRFWIYGLHPVEAALRNDRRNIATMLATPNASLRLAEAISARGIEPAETTPKALDRLLGGDAVHQGVAIETGPLPPPEFESLSDARLVVVLDQVTDPHNVGAILRSAAAFGADALVMTQRHSPPLDGVLAKAASGGLEYVPVHLVRNLGETLQELGELGFRRIGLAGEGDARIEDCVGADKVALVLGAEGRGLRERTRSLCDALARIEATGAIAALNVSNAAAVALHALSRR